MTDRVAIKPDKKGCYLKSSLAQCCCDCVYHLEDTFHCAQHPKLRETSGGKCICSFHKGWVCIGFWREGKAHSEWPEHSIGCEMYTKREEEKAA